MGTTDQGKEKKGLSQAGVRLGKPKYLVSSGGCGGGLWWAWGGVGCGGVGMGCGGVGLNPWRVPPTYFRVSHIESSCSGFTTFRLTILTRP